MSEQLMVSDFYKLAILDLHHIMPTVSEYKNRYFCYFDKSKAQPIIDQYDAGSLAVNARDFVASINRSKDKIFEAERANGGRRR